MISLFRLPFQDVDRAVNAAERALKHGEWGRMNARDRGTLINRLADLMDEHKEELATIESIDSGAVYTLALKTHVGMSIDTWRYFAGKLSDIEWSWRRDWTFCRHHSVITCTYINYSILMLNPNCPNIHFRMVRQDRGFDDPDKQRASQPEPDHYEAGTDRRVRPHHALELSANDALVEDGSLPRRREYRRHQTCTGILDA